MGFSVDIIIPVRYRDEYDVCERLRWKKECNIPDNFNFIIVDFGSLPEHAKEINLCCEKLGFDYVYVDKPNSLWNASEARNKGILASTADYLVFEDVDLKHAVDFYEKIGVEIDVLLESKDWPFFVIPVTYLSEDGSALARDSLDFKTVSLLIGETYKHESHLIQHHAPASSFLVCSRKVALSIGGYDESFEGWGFEDSDFWLRLLMRVNINKPRDFFHLDTRNYSLQVNWRGWRSLFRIFADLVSNKGIYSFHIWHPIAEHRSDSVRAKNHKIFLQNCKNYAANNYTFTPLINTNKPKQLFLSKNPHSWNENLFKYFDNPIYIDEKNIDATNIAGILKDENVDCVIFNNPYGNERRLVIYNKIKELGVKSYVVERGALPWSIYIDPEGFCAESSSYSENRWANKNISIEEENITTAYINELKSSGVSLEPQASMIGGSNLKKKLFGESQGIKILFVALQSPSDTTTNFFCDQIGSYSNFINEVSKLPYLLPSDWKVIVKNHPLSIEKFSHPDILIVDEYHISDILQCCDAVTLINSGVGVLAQIYGKFTYTFGKAFYQCDGLNKAVRSSNELVSELLSNVEFDLHKSFKFINYLLNDFYSFASWTRAERKHTEQANLSISLNIAYSKVRIPNQFEEIIEPINSIDIIQSPLFDRYRLDEYLNRGSSSTKKTVAGQNQKVVTSVKTNEVNSKTVSKTVPKAKVPVKRNAFIRKFNKLRRNPRLFIMDALSK